MDSKELKWQRRDIFDYNIYEKEGVRSEELWNWHRTMYIVAEEIQRRLKSFVTIEFHGRIASVHYIMYEGRFFLPGHNMEFTDLPKITEEIFTLAIIADLVHEIKGENLELLELIIYTEPQPRPLLNNEYDFRKFIGTHIWKNSKGVVQ